MRRIKHTILSSSLAFIMIAMTACIHDDFDPPQPWQYPEGSVLTIAELRALFTTEPVKFDGDYSVYATVTMDDKSGNIYRNAFVQDHTGGINLRLVAPGGLYMGDSVRIYLKGTTLGSYQRMLQLDNVNVDRNIDKIATLRHVEPKNLNITAIKSGNYQGQLVRLDNVQFTMADVGKTFADKEGLQTINHMLEDCDGNRVIVRTSGYASFADQPVPGGNGSLTAVVAQYQNDVQLYIRRIAEVNLTGDRCPIPGDDYNLISINTLKNNFYEGITMIPANSRIEGVVISDRENGNHPGQNLFIYDDSGAGIVARFTSFHSFDLGTRIRIVFASPMPVSQFRGLLQIENIPGGNAYELGPGTLPEPVTMNIAGANANINTYQSTLVRIENVTIAGNSLSGNLTMTDASGQMMLYIHDWATFAGNPVPEGILTITGILSVYDNPQLLIRNLNDIRQ